MVAYTVRRLFVTLVIVVGALTLLFLLMYLLPGDPAKVMLGPRASDQLIEKMRHKLGLDQPMYITLPKYLFNVLQGDLGTDPLTHKPVSFLVLRALPYTTILAFGSLTFATLLGIPLGGYSASNRNTLLDRIIASISIIAITVPPFLAGIFLLLLAIQVPWLPVAGGGELGNFLDVAKHSLLPCVALGLGWVGYIARLTRSTMLEILDKDYIRTIKAQGAASTVVTYKYALRNALGPVIAMLGVGIGKLLGGAVLVEIVFNRPGLGRLVYNGILTRNYPIVQGGLLFAVFLYAVANLLADLSHSLLDPRIRLS